MEWIYSVQGYPLIFITTFIEGTSVPFPGAFLLAWTGFLLGRDIPDLAMATGLGIVGYVLGSVIPYLIGRIGGRPLIEKVYRRFRLPVSHIDLAEKWFNKYGLVIVAVSRPFFLGNYVSFVAGMARTRPVPFFLCTAAGICPWVLGYLYLGVILGRHWQKGLELISQYATAAYVAVFVLVLVVIAFRNKLLHTR